MPKRLIALMMVLFLLALPRPTLAQDYYFVLEKLTVDVFWNEDGTQSLDYSMVFQNDPGGHAIEFVDLGLPNSSFDVSSISATVDGRPVGYISEGEFQGTGSNGVAISLGSNSIPPGGRGTVRIIVGKVRDVLHRDDDGQYASAVFAPAYFQSSVIYGKTDLTVTFHLPPGVQPDEPRWHSAPSGFPDTPTTGLDAEGRITYTWKNANANGHTSYEFGASFPANYIPESTIVRQSAPSWVMKIDPEALIPVGCVSLFVLIIGWSIYSESKRKFKYLPPQISIEGHGIKRGLTAVEAAVLLEQPLNKIFTMILFSTLKKEAAEVTSREPLDIKVQHPIADDLHNYEKDFLRAFQETGTKRQKELQDTAVALVRSVSAKMKGFSRKESIAYYQDITKRAWEQVQAAGTPELASQKFDELMGWTMLDRNFDDRAQDIFRNQPVYVPHWWGRFDPGYASKTLSKTTGAPSVPSTSGGKTTLPHLPGSDFAASLATGVQGFSSKVVGNISDFTSKVTGATNPVPKSSGGSYRSGGGSSGGGCACACACAGCACACAGGGR